MKLSSLRGFGLQRALGDLDQLKKRRCIGRRDVRQHCAARQLLDGVLADVRIPGASGNLLQVGLAGDPR